MTYRASREGDRWVKVTCTPSRLGRLLGAKERTVYVQPIVYEDGHGRPMWMTPSGRFASQGMLDAIDELAIRHTFEK